MRPPLLLCALSGSEHLAGPLVDGLDAEAGRLEGRHFPDGETYLRFHTNPAGRDLALLSCLRDPDAKLLSLLFAARTAWDLGANSVGLIAPYMPYLRQDIAFHPGEAVSARHVGALLSDVFSWVATLDPHLHRLCTLADVFAVPAIAGQAAPAIAAWIETNVERPVIIGPDAESEQWASAIAAECNASSIVLQKDRLGDHSVEIEVPPGLDLGGHTPVMVDDIVSSGGTLSALISQFRARGYASPICCVVHALFSRETWQHLLDTGARRVVSTTSLNHPTNAIDVSKAISSAAIAAMRACPEGGGG